MVSANLYAKSTNNIFPTHRSVSAKLVMEKLMGCVNYVHWGLLILQLATVFLDVDQMKYFWEIDVFVGLELDTIMEIVLTVR